MQKPTVHGVSFVWCAEPWKGLNQGSQNNRETLSLYTTLCTSILHPEWGRHSVRQCCRILLLHRTTYFVPWDGHFVIWAVHRLYLCMLSVLCYYLLGSRRDDDSEIVFFTHGHPCSMCRTEDQTWNPGTVGEHYKTIFKCLMRCADTSQYEL